MTLVACILGSSVVFLDGSVVNVALPALAAELDAGLAAQQWVVDAYLLTLSSFLLLGGSVGDLLGRRRVFEISLLGFGVTSALCAIAPTDELLVAARALQGVDGAFLVPSSLAIIAQTFEGEQRGRAIGTWTAWTGIAFVIGPLVAGLLIEALSWRLVFAINVPLVAATIVVLRSACPDLPPAGYRPRVDWLGALLCAIGLGGPVYALIEAPAHGFGSPLTLIPLLAGVGVLACFLAYERRAAEPMLDLTLFRDRNFSAANAVSLGVYAGLGAMTFLLVLFLQQVADYSALEAGLALMPVSAVMLAGSGRFGALAERIGPRLLMAAGPLVAAIGMLLLLRVGGAAAYFGEVLPAAVVFGIGLAMTVAPLTALVLGSVPASRVGIASGVNNAIARVASLVAIAAVGAIVAASFEAGLARELGPARATDPAATQPRPLSVATGPEPLTEATRDASVSAFHLAIAVSAALVAAGGLVAAAAVRNPRRS